jgi:hypothetical protein
LMVDKCLEELISNGICTRGRSHRAIRPSGILSDLRTKAGRSFLEVEHLPNKSAHLSLPTFNLCSFLLPRFLLSAKFSCVSEFQRFIPMPRDCNHHVPRMLKLSSRQRYTESPCARGVMDVSRFKESRRY